jgi:hypothetical protein
MPNQVPSPVRDALRGALWGVAPGAITSIAYGCLSLAAQGDLAGVAYESYIIPTLAAAGAIAGLIVGGRIGWVAAGTGRQGIGEQVYVWLANGSVAGFVLGNLLALLFWLTPRDGTTIGEIGEGRLYIRLFIQLDLAGLIVGSIVAWVVGLALRRNSGKSCLLGAWGEIK